MGLILPRAVSRALTERSGAPLSRRRLLQSGLSGLGLLMGGCGSTWAAETVGQHSEPLNQSIEALLLSQKPTPEYPLSAIQPGQLLVNTFDVTPQIDPRQYSLTLNGEVNHSMTLSLSDLQKLPLTSMVIQHVCVEGWSAIVQWGGVRLRDLIPLVQPTPKARYVYFKSADGYYESWDLASAMHPQTLMAYQKDGLPLSAEHGAPLRLASPIKLGYKLSKWVTQITFVSALSPRRGYWEDQGYEWFAGL
jgi:DMSO/TMAO reductase YedYZ molybdopterin-dependent catalytic subunit